LTSQRPLENSDIARRSLEFIVIPSDLPAELMQTGHPRVAGARREESRRTAEICTLTSRDSLARNVVHWPKMFVASNWLPDGEIGRNNAPAHSFSRP
jgi:hypothetical protein